MLKGGEGGRARPTDLLATPGPAMDFLPVILIYPARPLHSFRVDPRRMGGVVFQWWCTGQPAFIRMNLRDDKISPVTQLGYEIRVLIEFSGAGQGVRL